MAEVSERYWLPQISCAWAPTPAAPIVCAKVFNVSMAANGLSILSLYFCKMTAYDLFSPSFVAIKEGVTLRITASIMEQRKEKNKAIIR